MSKTTPLCAAIAVENGKAVDSFLEALVDHLHVDGFRISGVLQRRAECDDTCCADMGLEMISTGEVVEISQPLGKGSQGCRLDPRGLADITARLLIELDSRPDLLILNRFGKGEQDGQGFRQLIAKAVELSIPVLVGVRAPYLPDWRQFTGDLSIELSPDLNDLQDWCSAVLPAPQKAVANG